MARPIPNPGSAISTESRLRAIRVNPTRVDRNGEKTFLTPLIRDSTGVQNSSIAFSSLRNREHGVLSQ
jgi:hypothetical protein